VHNSQRNSSFIILTGLSGAGKTQSMKALEDLGFFCIDNLPPVLLQKIIELQADSSDQRRYAIAMDIRGKEYFKQLEEALDWLERADYEHKVIFLECSDSVLVRRFSEVRRAHPLAGKGSIYESIALERKMLAPIRERSDVVIDTSGFKPVDLKAHLCTAVTGKPLDRLMLLDVFSFGFKYGAPIDADIIFDVRFVPNPYWVPDLRNTNGLDAKCSDYVFEAPIASYVVKTVCEMLVRLIPHYSSEGKSRLTIGIGCSGGQHRSVAITERLAKELREAGVNCQARHREIAAGNVSVEEHDLEEECVAP